MQKGRYTVDTHPKKTQIINALTRGDLSFRDIGQKFGLSKSTLHRYMKNALIPRAATIKAKDKESGNDLINEMNNVKAKAYKMLNACDKYLTDPEHPDEYYLGPQAHEIRVTYKEPIEDEDGKITWITKKADLQELINENMAGMQVSNIHITHSDPRKLLLETTNQLYKAIELTGKILGDIKSDDVIIINNPKFIQVQQILLDSITEFPELRRIISNKLLAAGTIKEDG